MVALLPGPDLSVFALFKLRGRAYGSTTDGWVSYEEGELILENGYNSTK